MDPAGPLKLKYPTNSNSIVCAVNDHADRIAALESHIHRYVPGDGRVHTTTEPVQPEPPMTASEIIRRRAEYNPLEYGVEPRASREPPQPEAQDELTPYGEALQEAERLRKENKALSEELTHLKKSMVATYQATRRPDDTDFVIAHLDKLREENWAEIKKLRKENEELTEAVKAECDNRDEMHDKIERLEKQLKEAIHKGDVSGMFCDSLRMERNNLREDKENLRERLQQYEGTMRHTAQVIREQYPDTAGMIMDCIAPIEEKSDE